MKKYKHYLLILLLSPVAGLFVYFTTAVISSDNRIAILAGVTVGLFFLLGFMVWYLVFLKRATKILQNIKGEPLYTLPAAYYDDKYITMTDGWLVLTHSGFVFMSAEKEKEKYISVPLSEVEEITYDEVMRGLKGVIIRRNNAADLGFLVTTTSPFKGFERIKEEFEIIR